MGQVNQPEDILTRLAKLEKRVEEVSKRSGIGNAVSRGRFSFVDAGGGQRVYFGPVNPGGATGFLFTRQDGSLALTMEGTPGFQFVALRDRAGNIILSDDTSSGQGLATPYIPYLATKMSEVSTPVVSTTSGTMVELWRIHGQKQHPKIRVLAMVQSDVGTTGTIQLAELVSTVIDTNPIPSGDNSYHVLEGPVTGTHKQDLFIRVEMQRLTGAGALRCTVCYAEGRQT